MAGKSGARLEASSFRRYHFFYECFHVVFILLNLNLVNIISQNFLEIFIHFFEEIYKKHVNWDSHIASSPISQSCFFEEARCSILASSQRKFRGHEFLKFDITINKIKKFKFV